MKFADLINQGTAELEQLLIGTRATLHGLRQKAHRQQLKQVHTIRATRQMVARVATILRRRRSGSSSVAPAGK